ESGAITTSFSSPGFPTPRELRIQAPTAGGNSLTTSTDVAYSVLGPHSVRFNDRQTLLTLEDFSETVLDCTIEVWIKWSPDMTASTLQVGANAGPKLLIARDNLNSLNDRFGILT